MSYDVYTCSFTISNKGDVQMDYKWSFQQAETAALKPGATADPIEAEAERPPSSAGRSSKSQHSGRPITEPREAGDSSGLPQARMVQMPPRPSSSLGRPATALALAYEAGSVVSEGGADIFPFTIEPDCGTIAAGKKGTFLAKFSPLDVLEYEAVLTCRWAAFPRVLSLTNCV